MPHLKFHGKVLKQYHGMDQDTLVVAGPGDVIHISEEKANRLLKDFPTEFEVHRGHVPVVSIAPKTVVEHLSEPEKEAPEIEAKDDQPAKNKMVKKAKRKVKDPWR